MTGRYEKTSEQVTVLYRSSTRTSPHYIGGEFIDIHIDMTCPACPDEGESFGILELEENRELGIVAKCPKCMYRARVSVYEEGAK